MGLSGSILVSPPLQEVIDEVWEQEEWSIPEPPKCQHKGKAFGAICISYLGHILSTT